MEKTFRYTKRVTARLRWHSEKLLHVSGPELNVVGLKMILKKKRVQMEFYRHFKFRNEVTDICLKRRIRKLI